MNEKLERDNSDLAKQVATLQLTVEKYEEVEQELSDKEVSKATAIVLYDFPFLYDLTTTIKILKYSKLSTACAKKRNLISCHQLLTY